MAAIAAMLASLTGALKVKAAYHDEMPGVGLRAARHRVDGGAVTLARAMPAHFQHVALRGCQHPLVQFALLRSHWETSCSGPVLPVSRSYRPTSIITSIGIYINGKHSSFGSIGAKCVIFVNLYGIMEIPR